MTWIIDTSAFFKGGRRPGRSFTVQGVLDEVEGGRARRELDLWLAAELEVRTPSPEFQQKLQMAISEGERARLSATDLDLLALALELGGVLLTADYTMQNVAAGIELTTESVGEKGIEQRLELEYWCPGCRSIREEGEDCAVCGSVLKIRPRRQQ